MSLINSLLKVFVGDKKQQDLKKLEPIVGQVHAFDSSVENLSNDDLRQKTIAFKEQISKACETYQSKIKELELELENAEVEEKERIYEEIDSLNQKIYETSEEVLNKILPEAFAVMKETAKRFTNPEGIYVSATPFDRELSATKPYLTLEGDKAHWSHSWDAMGKFVEWDMVHYDVQLIGGTVLHQGKIAEMMTGEGKTLVATLPIYLNALTGRGVHIVTVNDYLAKRDAAWNGPLFEFHGLSVDCIDIHQPNTPMRRKAYQADITYGTNNEFGFDYLRDNMAHSVNDLVQRSHNYAIVDEVDSVLIDDARTPLIISGQVPQGDRHEFNELKPRVENLVNTQQKYLTSILADAKKLISEGKTEEGGLLLLRVHRGLPKNTALIKFLSQEGNKQLLQKTENFYMQDNNREMPKVDKELYFVIDEKNNSMELTDKGIETLSGNSTEKDFFVLPDVSIEMGKINKSNVSEEDKLKMKEILYREFNMKSERIHTIHQLLKAYTLFEKDVEYVVIDDKVLIVDEQTGRIMEGRRYSDGLHQAIEAKENVKIEDATQTYATITLQNYFRMYKKLAGMTGTATTEAGEFWQIYKLDVVEIPTNKPILRKDQEDLVYKTKREKYNAVIDEIAKLVEQKRPVLVGTTSVEISELLSKMLNLRKIQHNVLNAKLHKKEAEIVAEAGKPGVVTIATNMAGRGTDIKLTEEVKNAGGLAIIGTERHDSRRVDRQLRGRSGRQGDPGSSQFFVSLEDNLMRLFGSERIAKLMDTMGLQEGEVIQHRMISNSIERAQKKVEENNFGIRKRLLEYDDIMNSQREVVYKRRRHALDGVRLQVDISNMIYETLANIVYENKTKDSFENFEYELIKFSSTASPVDAAKFKSLSDRELIDLLFENVLNHYKNKIELNAAAAFPVIKNVYETQGNRYERISVAFTDGIKTLNVITNLKSAYETNGRQLVTDFEKNITLAIIDENWKEHLRKMDELKTYVQNATYEQKDPLLIYKFEAYNLFKEMINETNLEVISFLFKGALPNQNPDQVQQATESKREKVQLSKAEFNQEAMQTNQTQKPQVTETIMREQPKIGRNDKVTIKNVLTGETKDVKYKQAEPLLENGTWVVI